MAPLAAGAALLLTESISGTQLIATRGLSHSNDNAGDASDLGSKDAWLFAPIAIFVLILISLLWLLCFATKAAKNEAERKKEVAGETVKSLVQDLPPPRLWGSGSSSNRITQNNSTTKCEATTTSSDPDEEACTICLETFISADMVRQMRACEHVFHQQCFEDWILQCRLNLATCKKALRCPICRRVVVKAVEGVRIKKPEVVYFGM